MPDGRGQHVNSKANLRPQPFQPGYDANRGHGTPAFGSRILTQINKLANLAHGEESNADDDGDFIGRARFNASKLKKILDDEGADHASRSAAMVILAVTDPKWDKIHRQPRALATLKELLDRHIGRPTQRVEVDVQIASVADATSELAAIHDGDPRLVLDVIGGMVRGIPGLHTALLEHLQSVRLPAAKAHVSVPVDTAAVDAAVGNEIAVRNIKGQS